MLCIRKKINEMGVNVILGNLGTQSKTIRSKITGIKNSKDIDVLKNPPPNWGNIIFSTLLTIVPVAFSEIFILKEGAFILIKLAHEAGKTLSSELAKQAVVFSSYQKHKSTAVNIFTEKITKQIDNLIEDKKIEVDKYLNSINSLEGRVRGMFKDRKFFKSNEEYGHALFFMMVYHLKLSKNLFQGKRLDYFCGEQFWPKHFLEYNDRTNIRWIRLFKTAKPVWNDKLKTYILLRCVLRKEFVRPTVGSVGKYKQMNGVSLKQKLIENIFTNIFDKKMKDIVKRLKKARDLEIEKLQRAQSKVIITWP